MHSVNLDLLRTGSYHPDGRPRDAHAHHRTEHHAVLRTMRRDIWRSRLAFWHRLLFRHAALAVPASPIQNQVQ